MFVGSFNAQAAQQKKRTPAWTDRVLWRSSAVKQLSYSSAMLTASDHMPVAATFSLPVQEYNR
jgi:endonuclease/exonuclease/phosphatase family metal-dependent hydrolase